MKSFTDVKKIISLLTLEIKSLDPTSKYSAIVHLEETIDILKLEALKELPQTEEDIKDEDSSEDIEVSTSDKANEGLPGEKSLGDNDIKSSTTDDKSEGCYKSSTNQPQDDIKDESSNIVNEEAISSDKVNEYLPGSDSNDDKSEGCHDSITEPDEVREPSIQDPNTEIKEEPKLVSLPDEDPKPSDTIITIEDDETEADDIYSQLSTRMNLRLDSTAYDCKICKKKLANRRGLIIHYNIHAGKFTCHRCKAPFSAQRELDKHITNHLNCLKLEKLRSYTNPQEWIIDPSNPILNPEINESRNLLQSENNKDQPRRPNSFYCESCNLYFSTQFNLRKHQERPVHQEKVAKLGKTQPKPQSPSEPVTQKVSVPKTSQKSKDELLQCPECPNLYSTERSLMQHRVTHTDKFKCPDCERGFSCQSMITVHKCGAILKRRSDMVNAITVRVAAAECPKCGLRSGDMRNKKRWLIDHQLEHTDTYKCHSCDHGFSSTRALRRHTKGARCKNIKRRRKTMIKRSRLLYSAPGTEPVQEGKVPKEVEIRSKSIRYSKKELLQCPDCQKIYTSRRSLMNHKQLHTGKYKCPKCESRFPSPSSLANHNCDLTLRRRASSSVPSIGVAGVECNDCGMRFSKNKTHLLKDHQIEHTDKFKCHLCFYGFLSARILARHLKLEKCKDLRRRRKALIERSRLLYSAPVKEERTLEEVEMKPAPQKTTPGAIGEALSECLECGMRFFTKGRAKFHKLEHTNKFKCHTCSFGFSSIRALAKHLSAKEKCLHIKRRREAMIKKSRLLYSAPKFKSKSTKSVSDIEKLKLQKITQNSSNFICPADDVEAKKADTETKSEANQASTSETQSKPVDAIHTEDPSLEILEIHSLSGIKSPTKSKNSTIQILNHNFPGVTFHPEVKS